MVVAVAGAIGLGEFFEAATVAFFFSLSLYLENWSVGRARNAVSALLDLAPPTARVLYDDGSEAEVPASAVAVNAKFIVRGGDRIPLDGEVVGGAGAVDQAPITGESALVPKEPGDEVYAGTINGEGTLTVRATKKASDTVLSKIIRMRMIDPPEVAGWTVVILGGIALVVDTLTAFLTYSMQKGSVNIRALFLHNLSDALASVAVIIGGSLIILYDMARWLRIAFAV